MKFKNISLKAALLGMAILIASAIHLSATVVFFQKWIPRFGSAAARQQPIAGMAAGANVIQIALLLDTSNSMDGLIEQAKSQLWKILNELSRARKDGKIPELQIALYEYGNDGLPAGNGHIRQVQPFTGDMDLVSEKLFSLATNGGNEFCGQVIHTALGQLQWSAAEGALRLIYIAGNEPFDQGNVTYAEACAWAREKDVIVNTIFCGNYEEGINGQWKNGATLGKGSYASIDHNAATSFIESPYDGQISQLNLRLNATYLAYGARGQEFQANQAVQDQNASRYSKANVADRTLFKSSANYRNEQWDLVDAYKKDKKILAREKENLPDSLRQLSQAELETEIQRLAQEREEIQELIRKLGEQRQAYIDMERAKAEGKPENNLGDSILQALREQAKRKGFIIE